jgi:hypothetical protein
MGKAYPITIYISKSSAAKKLNINRKTIQRKVQAGKLSQDAKGRIRWDELVAVLRTDETRGRRGPKTPAPNAEGAAKIQHFDPKRRFVEAMLEPNDAMVQNQKLDGKAVARLTRQMAGLSIASLEAVVKAANTLITHKSRLARVGVSLPTSEILAELGMAAPLPSPAPPSRSGNRDAAALLWGVRPACH